MKDLFCNCICAWQPVQVVHGDGRIRSLSRPVTVGQLLQCHPHHFVSEPTSHGPLYHSGMLPFDKELEEGRVYLLLPLPRLLPYLASTFPNPPCCSCFNAHKGASLQDHQKAGEETVANLRLRSWLVRHHRRLLHVRHRVSQSKLVRSLVGMSTRMLPARLRFRISFHKLENENADHVSKAGEEDSTAAAKSGEQQYCSSSRNRWRPGLECISEVDLLTGLLQVDSEVSRNRG